MRQGDGPARSFLQGVVAGIDLAGNMGDKKKERLVQLYAVLMGGGGGGAPLVVVGCRGVLVGWVIVIRSLIDG